MAVNPKMAYVSLRWICILYILPVGYVAVLLTYRVWLQGKEEVWKDVFISTQKIADRLTVVAVLWFCVACILFLYRWQDHMTWRRKLKDNIPIDDPMILRTFDRVCRSLNIPEDKMRINKNVLVQAPLVLGSRHPQVLLPEYDYTESALEMILYHELSHYLHRDLIFKNYVMVVMIIHCFNPLTWGLLRKVNAWSEYMADVTAMEASGNQYSLKTYYENIVGLFQKSKKKKRKKFFALRLIKNENTISSRIDFMKNYRMAKRANGLVSAFFTVAFVFISTSIAFVSGSAVAKWHDAAYRKTERQTNMTIEKTVVADDDMIEYYCQIEDLDQESIQAASLSDGVIATENAEVFYSIDEVLDSKTRHVSDAYLLEDGQEIGIYIAIKPDANDIWFGIIADDGRVQYVRGKGMVGHNFKITQNNGYRVFLQNNSTDSTKISVIGQFFIR